jgi:predicted enzyme related to lactoylglutathione lyase
MFLLAAESHWMLIRKVARVLAPDGRFLPSTSMRARITTTARAWREQSRRVSMKRVTGIGGVFFKSKDPKALGEWYRTHLGLEVESWGGATFNWVTPDNPTGTGMTLWTPFKADTEHFAPSTSSFMINFRVHDLHGLLAALRAEGCDVDAKIDESEYGMFGWVMDPEGNRVELWQPPEGQ